MEEPKFLKATHYKQRGQGAKRPSEKQTLESLNPRILEPSINTGFTLLEIIIALAIVGAVVITILHTVNYHADVAYDHTLTTRMLLVAREKITEMETDPKNATGVIPGTDFTYENLVNTTEDERLIELKTIINGYGKKVILSELVVKKEIQKSK